ncbi:hypothetical protein NKI80_28665 [Mesorhizobium sp. M0387]|uniref:hypothetical protein n=1 Tax=Mesorhizobium sp. M0387 TaxID=2956940 RepID=UPI00333D70BE
MQKKEKTLVFPGLSRLLTDIGVVSYERDGLPSNFYALRSLIIPFLRRNIKVRESDVLDMYPGIKFALDQGDIIDVREYVVSEGYFYGVLPLRISFDEGFYIEEYEDVYVAVSSGKTTPMEHWLTWGYKEGRVPSGSVDYLNAGDLL